MKRTLIISILLCTITLTGFAQRTTDKLDRGLVAIKVSDGVFLSWRITGEEYYDTEYNVYRDGTKLNETPLSVSNFTDKQGTATASYTVRAVSQGQEQSPCPAINVWGSSYKEIKLAHPGIKSRLCPNDATCADVDGDGELEILLKYDNIDEMEQSYPKYGPTIDGKATGEYSIFECLKLDGTRLWWVNCGPNMGDFQNNEQNIMAYDWDGDGRAEAVMRAADGTVVHMADGTTYTVGDASKNVRDATGGGTNWFVTTDGEYLLYMDGLTGKPYQCMPYPLKRLEQGETDLNRAWGDGYGHRCSKHFVGAPYLDGHKPSIFLARGIYTRHKMIAYDVDPETHELTERWHWTCNANGPWKGQGYHNYCVADVDWDGRDEIVFGSMVIDDNGYGLSTIGLGHGDAEQVGDLDPYRHGLEIFACMETNPGTNYRDATTSKIYYRYSAAKDVGRCMAGNFTNDFPGSLCTPTDIGAISSITAKSISGLGDTGVNQNFRIYWDGDLCEETFNYLNGKNTEGCIAKYGSWTPIYTCAGSMTNNDTKGTPCFQGDILGDWREEIIMRTANNNIRIYSTPTPTTWRNYSLWHDHQYRNAVAWQMCGYNQPPKTSYFLGEMEEITIAPPPLTTTGRVVVDNGSTIDANINGQHVLVSGNTNMNVSIAPETQPSVLTINVPTWVQGTAQSECTTKETKINRTTYTCTVTGDGIGGNARLVKQGDGTLVLPKAEFTHTGETNVWGGTLCFDGSMKQSPLWLNRHTRLYSDGGEFLSIKADYGATVEVGKSNGEGGASCIKAEMLSLGFGSRLVVDLYADDLSADRVETTTLKIERKTGTAWEKGGPAYLKPVIEVVGHLAEGQTKMAAGKYVIAHIEHIEGAIEDLILEGIATSKKSLYIEDGKLIVEILPQREPTTVVWTGAHSDMWDVAETENFSIGDEQTGFVAGDEVVFGDEAQHKSIAINEDVLPASITVNSSESYTFSGQGAITGNNVFIKEGTGTVTMKGTNSYTGGNHLRGGITKVSALANQYSAVGNLGGITTNAALFTMENGAVLQTTGNTETASPMKMIGEGGLFDLGAEFKMNAPLSGTALTKRGSGCLFLMADGSLERLVMAGGDVALQSNNAVRHIELQGGTLWDDVQATTHSIHIPEGKTATWQLTYVYYTAYANKITGSGTLNIVPRNTVQRVRLTGNWSEFEGTIRYTTPSICLPLDASTGMPKGTLYLGDGCSVANVARAFTIGKLIGTGRLIEPIANFSNQSAVNGSNTWNVGNSFEADGDFTFDGTFSDGGGSNKCIFNKVGTCTMTVTGQSNHSGATTVSEGTLHIASGATLGTGELTIAKNAKLSGVTSTKVALTNSKTTVNGTLQVGANANSTTGMLDFGGKNVTFNKNSVYQLVARKCASAKKSTSGNGCAMIDNVGTLRMNGIISLQVTDGHTLQAGDSVRIFSAQSVSGTPTFDLPTIEGLEWDTTHWEEGYLHLKGSTDGVIAPATDMPVNVVVYTIGGCRMDSFNCTRSEIEEAIASNIGHVPGICILHIRGEQTCELIKWIKR